MRLVEKMRTATLREYRQKSVAAKTHLEKGTYSIMQLCQVSSDHDSKRVEIHAVLRDRALFVHKDAYSKTINRFLSRLVYEGLQLTFV